MVIHHVFYDIMQVQAFRRNVLGICDNSVKERTSSERRNLLYLYPPNISSVGAVDEIDGIELINVEVNFSTTDGKGLKTVLKVTKMRHIPRPQINNSYCLQSMP